MNRKGSVLNLIQLTLLLVMLLGCPQIYYAQQGFSKKGTKSTPKKESDSLNVQRPDAIVDSTALVSPPDSVVLGDSLALAVVNEDSLKKVRIDSLKANSDLNEEVKYQAADSLVFFVQDQKLFLYSGSEVSYEKISLKGDSIAVDFNETMLYASGMRDSTGKRSGFPVFTDDKQPYSAQQMAYNFKSRKGRVIMARTKQDDQYLLGDSIMMAGKTEDGKDVFYVKNAKFTSCEADHPHFYIRSKKLKVISSKTIISGPLQLVIEDFPIPVVIPFGFFPNQSGHKSGIVLPQYGQSQQLGFFLKNMGYYWAVNDYLGLKFSGDVYTRGSWGTGLEANYKKRYNFDGSLRTTFNIRKSGERTDPDYSSDTTFSINWQHRQKFSPTASLNGNINIESAKFKQINALDDQFFQTTLSSNLTFNKSFSNRPYNLTVSLLQNQNNSTRFMNLTLPQVVFNRTRPIYPFKKKSGRMKKAWSWIENTNFSYTLNMKNSVSAPDSVMSRVLFLPTQPIYIPEYTGEDSADGTVTEYASGQKGFQYYRAGIKQSIPLSTKLTLFKFFNLTPRMSFNEYWMFNALEKTFVPGIDSTEGYIDTDTTYGFHSARDFGFSLNTNSLFYGFYGFKGKNEVTLRQSFTPTFGYSWKPDFTNTKWGYYQWVQKNDEGEVLKYNRFAQSAQGSPRGSTDQRLNFGLNTRLELKLLDRKAMKDSLVEEKTYKKIGLLDAVGISSSYNFAADSMNLANFILNARTNMFKNKLTFSYNSVFDPYHRDSSNVRKSTFAFSESGKLGYFSSQNIAVTASIRPRKRVAGEVLIRNPSTEWTEIEYLRNNYVDYDIPWNASFTYNLRFSGLGESQSRSHTVSVRGDVSITPRWKIGYQSGFDFEDKKITYTNFSINRDLHCWELKFGFVPFGERKNFTFSLGVKSPTLKDLKISKGDRLRDKFF